MSTDRQAFILIAATLSLFELVLIWVLYAFAQYPEAIDIPFEWVVPTIALVISIVVIPIVTNAAKHQLWNRG